MEHIVNLEQVLDMLNQAEPGTIYVSEDLKPMVKTIGRSGKSSWRNIDPEEQLVYGSWSHEDVADFALSCKHWSLS